MKVYPLSDVSPLFSNASQTFAQIGVKINPSLEGLTATEKMLSKKTERGIKKLLSLEFNWLPAEVVAAYNSAKTAIEKKRILINKVYGNCRLNCKGCYVKRDDLFENHSLVHPDKIIDLIEEAVEKLGTKTLKYLGPSEFFRDKDVFKYLDRFQKLDVILGVFAKDPMFGDDEEVEKLFGDQGVHTSEELVKKLASYKNFRLLFNFRSFDSEKTNDLVRGGYTGKQDYEGDYKTIQTKSIQLLYKHFTEKELKNGRESRLTILNTPIVSETIDEAFEIFEYFTERGVPVCSTTSMTSGCGGGIYDELGAEFMEKFAQYYAKTTTYSLRRGIISKEYLEKFGPSPYAGVSHCMQMCSGLLIRETGQLLRCPGADDESWRDSITPEELLQNGLVWAWTKTKNFKENSRVNIGCLAKPKIFTAEFNTQVIELVKKGR
jgi:hypothetical protein